MDQPLFSDKSGVYRLPPGVNAARVEQAAQQRDFRFIHLDGTGVINRQELFERLRSAFEFPAYFGGNWDALLDMLRDLSWLSTRGYVVFVHNLEPLAASDRASYDHLLGVLHDAAAFWAERMHDQPPLIVVVG